MPDPFLLILAGPPGSGKTTVGRLVAGEFNPSAVIDADFFWASVVNGLIPPWKAGADAQNREMVRASLSAAACFVNAGYATVLEGHVGPWYLDLLKEELADLATPPSYVVLRPTVEDCLVRATGRTKDPRHAGALTSVDPIRAMYAKYEGLGIYEKHVLDNSGLSATETVRSIVEGLTATHEFALTP